MAFCRDEYLYNYHKSYSHGVIFCCCLLKASVQISFVLRYLCDRKYASVPFHHNHQVSVAGLKPPDYYEQKEREKTKKNSKNGNQARKNEELKRVTKSRRSKNFAIST